MLISMQKKNLLWARAVGRIFKKKLAFSLHGQRRSLVQVTFATYPGISGKRLRYLSFVQAGVSIKQSFFVG